MKTMISAALLVTAAGTAMATPTVEVKTPIGNVLAAEAGGMTLYTFRKDRRGVSNCTAACAASWPPFLVGRGGTADDGSTVIRRPDGTLQWATPAGLPLYFWGGDSAPGQTSGHGVGGLWDAAR
ncbi:hypothetical protein [Roseovarius sp. M141]|uniref:COG4315 family predicted lipoprotein n=1 Tax=Roseovarius sp. M141 TaxID=2583806 RepID=UPI0020CC37D0|nr:hypothetical protein [Roseovarius sp. M141]MCQ0092253.1 hypothetical protein [Roseovarius sp. M141]